MGLVCLSARLYHFWRRALLLLLLALVTPFGERLLDEAAAMVTADDCCPDEARECDGKSCSGACGHCPCCPAVQGVTPSPQWALTLERSVQVSTLALAPVFGGAPGYRAPPFRPPVA
jgi:hypothetical protein